MEHEIVFCFSLQHLSETFLILSRTEQDVIKNVYFSSYKVDVILVCFLMKLEFSWQIFEKCSHIKFHEIPSGGSRVVFPGGMTDTDRRTDIYYEANSHFSQFCQRV